MSYKQSGDLRIDALLKGYYWQDAVRKPVELTFGIRTQGKNGLNTAQRWMVLDALQQWSHVANINFRQVTSGGNLRFSLQDGTGGKANYNRDFTWWKPGTWRTRHLNHVNITIGRDSLTGRGERFLGVAIHEIGHALGLKHPGNYNGDDTGDAPFLSYSKDNRENSVMSYNSSFFRKSDGQEKGLIRLSPMPYDILAAQYLYGARLSNFGNTNYQFYNITRYRDGARFYGSDKLNYMMLSLWDSGGIDTVDLSRIIPDRANHENGYYININDGGVITFKDYYKSGRYRPLDNGRDAVIRMYDLTPAGTFIAYGANIENVIGSPKSDSIFGNSLNNRLEGLDGNDFIFGGSGTDQLFGGNGRDHLRGQAGRDYLNGGNGDDYLNGGDDNDVLYGEDGKDTLYGYDDNDTLSGGTGDDYLYGGRGDDYLYGNSGNDRLRGDSGTDYLYGWYGEDRLYGGSSNDYLNGGADDDFLSGESGDDELHGGSGNDTLEGGTGNDKLFGWGDNDFLTPGIGDDEVYGGWGDDTVTIRYFNDNDFVDGGSGYDTLELKPFDNRSFKVDLAKGFISDNLPGLQTFRNIERILSGSGNDTLLGDTGNNLLSGGSGHDVIKAGSGNDSLIPGGGDDAVYGEAGNDTIIVYNFDGDDILDGGEGVDNLVLNPSDNRDLDVSLERGDVGDGRAGSQVFTSIENVSTGRGNDVIRGDAADNHLHGEAGNDAIIGAEGDDSVIGGDGDDLLIGDYTATYNGHQYLMTDRMTWQAAQDLAETLSGNLVTINDADEQQWLTQTFGQHGPLWIGLTDAESEGTWQWVSGETPSYQNWSPGEPNDWGTGEDYALTGWGQSQWNDVSDTWVVRGIIEIPHLNPVFASGNDRLEGGTGNDTLYGGAGHDTLTPGSGNDNVFGEAGNDTVQVYDFNGTDFLDGGDGQDVLILDPADDRNLDVDVNRGSVWDSRIGLQTFQNFERIITGAGDDILRGDETSNQLEAGDGNDTIYGGAGDDLLSPGKGSDIVYGEAGDDAISVYDFEGTKIIDGGEGSDTLVLFPSDFRDLDVDLERGNVVDYQAGSQSLNNIENVVTVDGNDTLRGNANDNHFDSGAGNDLLYSSAGIDSYDGGDGIDTVDFSGESASIEVHLPKQSVIIGDGQPGAIVEEIKNVENIIGTSFADQIVGNNADNHFEGKAGNDSLVGRTGNDLLRGEAGNDYLRGDQGDDTLDGGAGRDRLRGDEGDDIIFGGADNDTIYVSEGADQIDGGADYDVIVLHGLTYGVEADLSQQTLSKADGTAMLTTIKSIERATGTQFDDRLVSHQDGSSLWGREGDDTLEGSASRDGLRGNEGNDILLGGDGNDFLGGNEGDDTLEGGAGDDTLSGHAGDNILLGGDGNDGLYIEDGVNYVDGGAGEDYLSLKDLAFGAQVNLAQQTLADANGIVLPSTIRSIEHARGTQFDDLLIGDTGNNRLWANAGNDTIEGGAGNDNLRGHDGDDVLLGGSGNDGLQGNLGNDILNGDAGNDSLFGNEGDDILAGGTGNDRLEGGQGSDIFVLGIGLGRDIIVDFELGTDRIGLQETVTFGQLSLTQQNGNAHIRFGDELLAIAQGINANNLTAAAFIDDFSIG